MGVKSTINLTRSAAREFDVSAFRLGGDLRLAFDAATNYGVSDLAVSYALGTVANYTADTNNEESGLSIATRLDGENTYTISIDKTTGELVCAILPY